MDVLDRVLQAGAIGVLVLLIWKAPQFIAALQKARAEERKGRMEELALWATERENDRKAAEAGRMFFLQQLTAERKDMGACIDRMSEYVKMRTHDILGAIGNVSNVLEAKHMQNQGKLDQILTEIKVAQRKPE